MDREKVIKGLEKLIDNAGCVAIYAADCKSCPYISVNGCIDQIHKDALELLEAQEPKQMHVTADINYRKIGECPNCGKLINSGDYPNYCGNCGQAVKWND